MPISFGGKPKEEDVVSLIAQKKYSRAVEVLKAQLQKRGANPSLRMQLADVLILAEKRKEAVALLLPLADQYANEGFAAKAVSVLKKVQKIDPGRKDVESRLARLIEEKQREAVVLPSRSPVGVESMPQMGMEAADGPALEIGFEIAPISAPAMAGAEPAPVPAAPPAPVAAPVVPPAPPIPAAPTPPSPVPPAPSIAAPAPPSRVAAPPSAPPPPPVAPRVPPAPPTPPPVATAAHAAPPATAGDIEDYDLMYVGDDDDEAGGEVLPLEAEIVEESAAPAADPMSAGQFADELMGLVDSVFQEFPQESAPAAPSSTADDEPAQGRQIVVSPLFQDFSVDEMVAVIQGLKLLTFERGEVILKEGQPGGSLYMLTSGRVRAFRKNAASGKQDTLADLKEGAFFGEISILTGQPRAASIVALTRCELLELDRPTLDGITATHPHVWDVLREFAKKRSS